MVHAQYIGRVREKMKGQESLCRGVGLLPFHKAITPFSPRILVGSGRGPQGFVVERGRNL